MACGTVSGVRSENTPKVRCFATVGAEPEVEMALVPLVQLLTHACSAKAAARKRGIL